MKRSYNQLEVIRREVQDREREEIAIAAQARNPIPAGLGASVADILESEGKFPFRDPDAIRAELASENAARLQNDLADPDPETRKRKLELDGFRTPERGMFS